MLTIQELLYHRGLPEKANTKLVRHKDGKRDVYDLYRNKKTEFLKYQSEQSKDVFKNTEYIVAFIGEEGTLARFVGVYKVKCTEKIDESNYRYGLDEVSGFEDLKNRVIINWGEAALSWNQWMHKNEKEVVEIYPPDTFTNKKFHNYLDFVLTFDELKDIVKNRNKFKDWYLMLSAVKGIYLIYDKKTGGQYIGSAYGENGIWGRWSEYVLKSGHGGNKKLIELVEMQKDYGNNFQFTVLMTLPKTLTEREVIKYEERFKRKLGTKAFGLNS